MNTFLHPHFIKFEKPKNELYLTFSAIVDEKCRSRILKIQDKIEKIIKKEEFLKDLGIEKERKGLNKRIARGDRFIYKYPTESLHFSIVNFATYNIISLQDFDNARKIIEKTTNFKKLKTKIKDFTTILLKFRKVKIRRIYLSAGIENSLALNAFPDNKDFFEILEKEGECIKKKMAKDLINNDFKIKAYPKENFRYFALNIFRFIDRKEFTFNQRGSFYKKIEEEINLKLKKNPIVIKTESCIVISDPYLANDKPQIDC